MNTTTDLDLMKLEDDVRLAEVRFANATEEYFSKSNSHMQAENALHMANEKKPRNDEEIQDLTEKLNLATIQYRDANSEYINAERDLHTARTELEKAQQSQLWKA